MISFFLSFFFSWVVPISGSMERGASATPAQEVPNNNNNSAPGQTTRGRRLPQENTAVSAPTSAPAPATPSALEKADDDGDDSRHRLLLLFGATRRAVPRARRLGAVLGESSSRTPQLSRQGQGVANDCGAQEVRGARKNGDHEQRGVGSPARVVRECLGRGHAACQRGVPAREAFAGAE